MLLLIANLLVLLATLFVLAQMLKLYTEVLKDKSADSRFKQYNSDPRKKTE